MVVVVVEVVGFVVVVSVVVVAVVEVVGFVVVVSVVVVVVVEVVGFVVVVSVVVVVVVEVVGFVVVVSVVVVVIGSVSLASSTLNVLSVKIFWETNFKEFSITVISTSTLFPSVFVADTEPMSIKFDSLKIGFSSAI